MVIVHGVSQSGKSSKAMSLLNINRKSIYFSLDFDESLEKFRNKNFEIKKIKNCSEINIEFEIGKILLNQKISLPNQVVVDPINLIKSKSNNILDIIENFRYIENRFNIEIILVLNTLKKFPLEEKLKEIKDVVIIETKKKEKYLKPQILNL